MSELLVGEERWGWEFRDARQPPAEPFPYRPPKPAVPAPAWATDAVEGAERAQRHGKRYRGWALRGLIAVPVAGIVLGSAGASLALFLVVGLAVLGYGLPAAHRHRMEGEYRDWLEDCLESQRRFQDAHERWSRSRAEHERQALEGATDAPQWTPLRPAARDRVDVFGGASSSWASLLAASGTSLVGSGASVSVLDLTQDRVARPLAAAVSHAGWSAGTLTLPEQLPELNLLARLSPEDVGIVVAEAAHAADPNAPAEARSVDATVVQQAAEQLIDAPVTLARLHTALRVLLRQVGPGEAGDLTRGEYARLTDLFGEAVRRSAEPRIFRLSAELQRLATPGVDGADGVPLVSEAPLQVVELSERVSELTGELLRQMLFQLVLHQIRSLPESDVRERVVVIAGADGIPRRHVERLDQLARRRATRFVLLFRHLRDDATELIGGGDAVLFMRLGNAREAEQAATFIGKEHRFVASQFTVSRTESTSVTTSVTVTDSTSDQESTSTGTQWSESKSVNWAGFLDYKGKTTGKTTGGQESTSTSHGSSRSEAHGTSDQSGVSHGETVGYQRVHEYAVTPNLLQGLSPTAFVLVDPRDPDGPRLGECDPAILEEPHVLDPPAAALPPGRA